MLWCSDADSEATHPDSDESTPQLQGSFLHSASDAISGSTQHFDTSSPSSLPEEVLATEYFASVKAATRRLRRQQAVFADIEKLVAEDLLTMNDHGYALSLV